MSSNREPRTQTGGDHDFAALFRTRTELVADIRERVERLLTLTAELKRTAPSAGVLSLELDNTPVEEALRRVLKASGELANGDGRGKRATTSRKPRRYLLVWRDSGEPVLDEQGARIAFKTRVRILRGPHYRALLGRQVERVQLVDSLDGNRVIHDKLTLGPAPGRPRPAAAEAE